MSIRLKKILCPTDFSEPSKNALRYALTLAQQYKAKILLLHVIEPLSPVPGIDMGPSFGFDERPHIEEQVKTLLDEIVTGESKEDIKIEPLIVRGAPFLEIVRTARTEDVDMIVIATHGHTGLTHMLLGSTAEKVVRKAPCPVLTVKHPEHEFVHP